MATSEHSEPSEPSEPSEHSEHSEPMATSEHSEPMATSEHSEHSEPMATSETNRPFDTHEPNETAEPSEPIATSEPIEINDIEEISDQSNNILDVKKLHIALLMNISQCHYKLEEYDDVIQLGKEIIKLDNVNIKTLFRMGNVYLKRNDTEKANMYLSHANKLNPGNKYIKNSLLKLEIQEKQNIIKQKKDFKNIFNNKPVEPI